MNVTTDGRSAATMECVNEFHEAPSLQSAGTVVDVARCPGCAAANWRRIGTTAKSVTMELSGRQFLQPVFQALQCNHCQLVFKSAIASEAELAEYYQRVDFRKWESRSLYPTEDLVLAAVRALPDGSRVLDFGCSTGRLLSRLTKAYECFGFEINAAAAEIAKTKGVRILDEHELFQAGEPFDAVLLLDVFEHLTEPTGLLARLVSRLRPGGRLVLGTGNADARVVAGDPARYWYFQTIEHLIMLTRGHADYLAERLGLRLTQWSECSHFRTTPLRWLKERSQTFAYEVFHTSRAPWLRPILSLTPWMGRAKNWPNPPTCAFVADHVVVVFEKC